MSTILVVDDDRATRHLIRGLLEREGYAVTAAASAAEALDQLERARFDLALVDVWMPGMNGIELATRLARERPALKVIVVTADDTPETLLQAVSAQAFRFVPKPVDQKLLMEAVHASLAAAEPRPIEVLSAKPEWVELLVPCDVESARRIQSFMAHLDADLPPEVRDSVGQAFHELLMNAIEWGGALDPAQRVRIACLRTRRMILYRIADPGRGFRFEELAHSAISNPEDQPFGHVQVREARGMRAGGFGLLITRALVDELIYNQAQNEVVFIKYLEG